MDDREMIIPLRHRVASGDRPLSLDEVAAAIDDYAVEQADAAVFGARSAQPRGILAALAAGDTTPIREFGNHGVTAAQVWPDLLTREQQREAWRVSVNWHDNAWWTTSIRLMIPIARVRPPDWSGLLVLRCGSGIRRLSLRAPAFICSRATGHTGRHAAIINEAHGEPLADWRVAAVWPVA